MINIIGNIIGVRRQIILPPPADEVPANVFVDPETDEPFIDPATNEYIVDDN